MADVIDISLHRTATRIVEELLEKRGLAFFLRRSGPTPFALDDRRVALAVELAARRLGRKPLQEARASCHRTLRRGLIARVAEAMVQVGL